jgi:hypothetical protein
MFLVLVLDPDSLDPNPFVRIEDQHRLDWMRYSAKAKLKSLPERYATTLIKSAVLCTIKPEISEQMVPGVIAMALRNDESVLCFETIEEVECRQ